MEQLKKSKAYKLIEFIWNCNNTESWVRLNHILYSTMNLAIEAGLTFDEDDFSRICKDFRGGHWFGVDTGGKGYPNIGSLFYSTACRYKNMSACKSYEKFKGIKPFIINNQRLYVGFYKIRDENHRRLRVTGFDSENGKIMIVSYNCDDVRETGVRKLHSYKNKEWLKVRKKLRII